MMPCTPIYLDWSATSMVKPDAVKDAMLSAMDHAASAARGSYGPGLAAMRLMFEARRRIQAFFNAPDVRHVVFTKHVTEALNTVLNGVLRPGDHVITSLQEHNSVLRPLHQRAQNGVTVDFLPCDALGRVRTEELSARIRPSTRMVVLNHASNVTGNVLDLGAVGTFCREHGILFVVDAAQSAGYLPLDIEKQGVDALCFTGHKGLFGPQGTGGFVLGDGFFTKEKGLGDDESAFPPLMSGGSGIHSFLETMPDRLPDRLEAGTANIPGLAGLSAGIRYLEEKGLALCFAEADARARRFYAALSGQSGIVFYGDYSAYEGERGLSRMPLVTLNLKGKDSADTARFLWEREGVCVRPGAHCAPLIHRHFGTVAQGMVRFSFSHFNSEDEVDRAAACCLACLREGSSCS